MLGRDVAEREDASRRRTRGVAHHRLREREPHLSVAAGDRDLPVRATVLGLQVALQHLQRRSADRLVRRHARDLLRRAVPEHDVPFPVDGDDAVGDVREDRDALLALDRDTLVELGVRQRDRGVCSERDQCLRLVFAPEARLQRRTRRALRAVPPRGPRAARRDRRGARTRSARPTRSGLRAARFLVSDRRARLHDVAADPAGRRGTGAERLLRALADRSGDHELVVLERGERRRVARRAVPPPRRRPPRAPRPGRAPWRAGVPVRASCCDSERAVRSASNRRLRSSAPRAAPASCFASSRSSRVN